MDPLYVTYVSASNVPPDELMTIQVDPKPGTASTIRAIAGLGCRGRSWSGAIASTARVP